MSGGDVSPRPRDAALDAARALIEAQCPAAHGPAPPRRTRAMLVVRVLTPVVGPPCWLLRRCAAVARRPVGPVAPPPRIWAPEPPGCDGLEPIGLEQQP